MSKLKSRITPHIAYYDEATQFTKEQFEFLIQNWEDCPVDNCENKICLALNSELKHLIESGLVEGTLVIVDQKNKIVD